MSEYPEVLDNIITAAEEGKVATERAQQSIIQVNSLIEEVVSLADEAIAELTVSSEQAQQSVITNLYAQEQTQIGLRLHNEANFSEESDARRAYQRLLHGYQVMQQEGTELQGLQGRIAETAITGVRGQQDIFRGLEEILVPAPAALGAIASSHTLLIEKTKNYKERCKKETQTVKTAQNSLDQANEDLKPPPEQQMVIEVSDDGGVDIARPADPLSDAVETEADKMDPLVDRLRTVQGRLQGLSERYRALDDILAAWNGQAPIPPELITLHQGLGQMLAGLGAPPDGTGRLPVLPEAIEASVEQLDTTLVAFGTAGSQFREATSLMQKAKKFLSNAKESLAKYLKR